MMADYSDSEAFPINESQVVEINLPDWEPSPNLCEDMIATIDQYGRHNFEAARLLYEAYETLPLAIAASESFWAYLCHVDLYRFVQKDWSIENKQKKQAENHYIADHYFFRSGKMRNALAGLWWGIKLTKDESRGEENKYDLSKILFSNYSLRTTWLTVILRIKPALHGILEFLHENPKIMEEKEEARYRYISNYINRLGSTKNLSALDKGYIKAQLKTVYQQIIEAKIEKSRIDDNTDYKSITDSELSSDYLDETEYHEEDV